MAIEFDGYQGIGPDIDDLLVFCTENGCSDLFITVGEQPYINRYGMMYQPSRPTSNIDWNNFTNKAIKKEQNSVYVREKMLDFSYHIRRNNMDYYYRVSAGFSMGRNTATFRMISTALPTFAKLGFDKATVDLLNKVFSMKEGINLICGVTGSGKTTTLAACMNEFTRTSLKNTHIITLEDPIEYTYPSLMQTRIMQKELGKDFASFPNGIKQALREHPTHIQVGETRDAITIRALVEGARTGHACVSTFHTGSVADTISRLNAYLIGENSEVMYDLVANLNFVMCQRLIPGRKKATLNYTYMFFTEQIKKILVTALDKGYNLSTTINKLMQDKNLLDAKIVKNFN